ncbi:exosortase A [Undibacterium sp. Jales W-56]|uniref:exosortase A n=1 Tax=Undibacterium sp. Jales W-56 TaxID=2897325 RepID=UPI0021D03B4F|nr:exosortase A [Undibacterium sp. Jales W-56]MCU6434119.1 exosortase A [Undibacterium sp. Jales W-56]
MTATHITPLPYPAMLAILIALLAPFAIYFSTAQSIVSVWNQSETFAHGYVILPISLWLIWQRKKLLKHMAPQPYWPGLIALAACGFGWLLAELGDVQVVRQYMFVAMLPAIVIIMLGWQIAWTLAFPLFFLLLAVPFGEIFIAPLIDFTADFTVIALQFTGIPVLRDGSSFTIPSGNWSVVEACSGVRYLISSVTLGCLYAYLTYRSTWKRVWFILASIIVPIIANGLRAYMIVMLGHLSGMTLAVGVDHLIYGWIFFGIVMFFMFWLGSFWRDDKAASDYVPTTQSINTTVATSRLGWASLATVLCLALWPAYAAYVSQLNMNQTAIHIDRLPVTWKESSSFTTWRPRFLPGSAVLDQSYLDGTQAAGMLINYYRNQNRDSAVISTLNEMVQDHDRNWLKTHSETRSLNIDGQNLTVRETFIKGSAETLLAWDWYWIDGQFTANKYVGKVLQTKAKFFLHGDDAASVLIYAPYAENPDEARTVMQRFMQAHLAAITQTLQANKKR